ncbi:MAG: phosphatase PAP2 family protein [Candidatus Bathyarchaeia archaeon]
MNKNLLQKNRKAFLATVLFFVAFSVFSLGRSAFQGIDVAVNLWATTVHTEAGIIIARAVSIIFDTTSIVAASLIIAAVLFFKKRKAQSILLLSAIGGDALFVAIIKNVDPVLRPENQLLLGSGFSYPSGHSAGVIVFLGLIAYYAWVNWKSKRSKIMVIAGSSLVVAFVGFDRVYLNVHWLSDVVGGLLFGAFWLSFCIFVYQWLKMAGKFESQRFNFAANVLFILGMLIAVLIVIFGWVFNYLSV